MVLDLPRHEVGLQERPGGRLPLGARRDDLVVRVELAQEGERAAEAVHALEEPGAPAPPAVREHDLPGVVARRQQRADVVDLHMQGGGIAGVARCQLDVAHAPAVEKRLVDAVRSRVHPRLRGAAASRNGGAGHEPRARSPGLDQAGGPIGGVEKPVSNQAGADQSLSVPSAQTLTRQTTRWREVRGCAGPRRRGHRRRTPRAPERGRRSRGRTPPAPPHPPAAARKGGGGGAEAEEGRLEMLDPEVGGRVREGMLALPSFGAQEECGRHRSAYGLFMHSECSSASIATVL